MIHQIFRRFTSQASLSALLFLALSVFSNMAHATVYTLYIHGRVADSPAFTQKVNYHDYSYWNTIDGVGVSGINKRAVNWNGSGRIADTNETIRKGLDCYCTGNNYCHVVAHSAGNLQIGYALAQHGSSRRDISFAPEWKGGAASEEVCITTSFIAKLSAVLGGPAAGPDDSYRQTGWNIVGVHVAAGAAGGSELATLNAATSPKGLDKDLVVKTARDLYDHNQTRGQVFNLYTGAKSAADNNWLGLATGNVVSAVLIGEDDGAVAYHSSGGRNGVGIYCNTGAIWWNPGTWFCNELKTGYSDGRYENHYVLKRDDGAKYNHSTVKYLVYKAAASFR